ncbi:MAG: extracellular solute-binding protein [Kouleothrix sp.]
MSSTSVTPTTEMPSFPALLQTPTAEERRTISFAVYEDEWPVFRPLIAQFQQEHPTIEVRLLSLDSALSAETSATNQQAETSLQRIIQQADVFPGFLVAPTEQASSLLLDLRSLADADAQFDAADFFPGALSHALSQQRLWMLPSSVRVPLIAYNATALKRQQIAPPTAAWTWTDLLLAAEQSVAHNNAGSDQHYGLLDPSGGVLTLTALLQARNYELALQHLPDLRLDTAAVRDAVDELRRLQRIGAVVLPGHTNRVSGDSVNIQQLVLQGKVAFWPYDSVDVIASQKSTPDDIGIMLFPKGINPMAGQRLYGYAASAGTANPQAAWQWIEFLSHQQLTSLSSVAPGHVPARRSVAEQYGTLQHLPPQVATAYQTALQSEGQNPREPDPAAVDVVQHVLDTILSGTQSPARALADAQQQLEQLAVSTPTVVPMLSGPVATPLPEPPSSAQTLRFLAPPDTIPELKRLAQRFQQQTPTTLVEIAPLPGGALPDRALIQQSDCFLARSSPGESVAADAALDLAPLLDADATLSAGDFVPSVLASYRHGQMLSAIPYTFIPYSVTYNAALFEQQGVPVPPAGWTPDDFLAIVTALSSNKGSQRIYGYAPFVDAGMDLFFFIRQFGGQVATGAGVDAEPNFTDPKVQAAIRWYLDLWATHRVMPKPTFTYKSGEYFSNTGRERIEQGQVGMWFAWGTGQFETKEFRIADAPLPLVGGLTPFDFRAYGLGISAQTQQATACWEWITFLSGTLPAGNRPLSGIPARISVAQGAEFQQQAAPATLQLYRASRPALILPVDATIRVDMSALDLYWFYSALTQVVEHQADVAPALQDAQQKTSAFMACLRQHTKAPVCAVQVDPQYQGYNLELPPAPGAG